MKKIFSLQIKAATYLFIPLLSGYPLTALPSIVSQEIPYQTFRDFATNKSPFLPGAKNINIKDKTGKIIGVLDKAPMPDFSSVNSTGIATLINPQYAVTVGHNYSSLFAELNFANGHYNMVGRSNISDKDFSAIRLNKLVTESIPATIIPADMDLKLFNDKTKFPLFYRIGSGNQEVADRAGNITRIDRGYQFLTGGTTGTPYLDSLERLVTSQGNVFNPDKGPVTSFGLAGDSGSPLFAWDVSLKKWLAVATFSMTTDYHDGDNVYAVIPADLTARLTQRYADATVTNLNSKSLLTWSFDKSKGEGRIEQDAKAYAMHGQKEGDMRNGKDLTFSGNGGVLLLQDDVHQGAGALTFNHSFAVMPKAAQTWAGGGVNIAPGAKVVWQVNGIEGDNLHKIGAGILHVNGRGINPGGLKVGDGTVVLAQQPDHAGKVQAFSAVNIASGRPRVILNDALQVNPDTISWGFRGGRLDVNGNSLTFNKLYAADYGAVLMNGAAKRADITLRYQGNPAEVAVREWSQSMRGTIGDLYVYPNSLRSSNDYFILKTASYSWFPADQRSDQYWQFVGNDRLSAIHKAYEQHKAAGYIYHGQFKGNLNIFNHVAVGTSGPLVLDGAIDIDGIFSQENGRLIFQGHPVIHAFNSEKTVSNLKTLGDNSLRSQPVSLDQPDWERRTFKLAKLILKDTHFFLGRNASLVGNVTAKHSRLTLGSPSIYIDLNDGNGSSYNMQKGESIAGRFGDFSQFNGNVNLSDRSVLTIQGKFNGSITASDSELHILSKAAYLDGYSTFKQTPLTLGKNAKLTARGGWQSDSSVTVGPFATLVMSGKPVPAKQVIPSVYTVTDKGSYALQEGSAIRVSPFVIVKGDISSESRAAIHFDGREGMRMAENLPAAQKSINDIFAGFKNIWVGHVIAPRARLNMKDTLWQLSGGSRINKLNVSRSLIGVNNNHLPFNTLRMAYLQAEQSAFVLRTDLKNSDKIVVSKKATGRENVLFIDLLKKPSSHEKFNIPLVIAPGDTNPTLFKTGDKIVGFSQITPRIDAQKKGDTTQWILLGFAVDPDPAMTGLGKSFLDIGYKNFMATVNNMYKRMGELRNAQGREGIWGRVNDGNGSAENGYSDHYTEWQIGFDKLHRQKKFNLFTGVVMSYADSRAADHNFRGNSVSFGSGLYASALFDSGAWIDLIGKYIYHQNNYRADVFGLEQKNYSAYSWYGGIESGYRYPVTNSLYIEPQAELIYGAVSGTTLKWQDNDRDMVIQRRHFNPLIGRVGVAMGKTFRDSAWATSLRFGLDYQFDLIANGKTTLRDASTKQLITGKKDGRMLYHLGINSQPAEKVHFSLQLERSSFGNYNVDLAINAQVNYRF